VICRHSKGDPNCGSTAGGYQALANQRYAEELIRKEASTKIRELEAKLVEQESLTPDSSRYEVDEVAKVGKHLVLRILYPNCAKCAYEGMKVLVFLNVDMPGCLKWKRIDPHFRDPKVKLTPQDAPPPSARFPATAQGWADAIAYAGTKP